MSKPPFRIYQFPGGLSFSKQGFWHHDGMPVSHPGLASYLNRSLAWSSQTGGWGLVSGEWFIPVVIEDTPYIVTALEVRDGKLLVQLNDETVQEADPATLRFGAEDVPYLKIRNCTAENGTVEARLGRSAMQALLPFIDEQNGEYYFSLPAAAPVKIQRQS